MKNRYLFLFLLSSISFTLYGQYPPKCLPALGGVTAGDFAPGCLMCGPVYTGSTAGFSPTAPGNSGFPCGTIENNHFLSIVADTSRTLTLSLIASDCQNGQGAQVVLFDQRFNPVSDCFSSGGTNLPGNVTAENLTPGEIYWIMIDGFAGDICDILIVTTGASFGNSISATKIEADSPETYLLMGTTVCFSVNSTDGSTYTSWEIPEGTTIADRPSDSEICLQFDEPGCKELILSIGNECFEKVLKYPKITISERIPEFQTIKKCKGGSVFIDQIEYTNPTQSTHVLGIPNQFGCDSTIFFEIIEVDFPRVFPPFNSRIPCTKDCLPIDFNLSPGNNFRFNWSTENGEFSGATNLPTANVCTPGIYRLKISDQNNNEICQSEIEIKGSSGIPERPNTNAWNLSSCDRSQIFYETTIPEINDRPVWEITNGTISNGQGTNQVEIRWTTGATTGEVCVHFENDCGIGEKACQTIFISQTPVPSFTATRVGCFDQVFTANYTGQQNSTYQFDWDFGPFTIVSGNGSGPYSLTTSSPGEFEIGLKVSNNGCQSGVVKRSVYAEEKPEIVRIDCIADWDSLVFIQRNRPTNNFPVLTFFQLGHNSKQINDSVFVVNNLAPNEQVRMQTIVQSFGGSCPNASLEKSCFALPCPFTLMTMPNLPDFFCPSDVGSYSIAPNLNFGSGATQDGQFSYPNGFLNPDGSFNAEDLPFGDFAFEAIYHEQHCFYRDTLFLEKIDTTPVVIECFVDSFLNALAVTWDPMQANRFLVQLNGGAINSQNHSSLLITPSSPDEEFTIFVQPIDDDSDCIFPPSTKVCKLSDTVSTFEKNIADNFKIIPNPSAGIFKIESDFKIEKTEVFAPSGKKILEQTFKEIDLTGFSKGVYFFRIHSENHVFVKRAVLF